MGDLLLYAAICILFSIDSVRGCVVLLSCSKYLTPCSACTHGSYLQLGVKEWFAL